MKKRRPISDAILRFGELYLFHSHNPHCPSESSLWGFFDKRINTIIYLEHSTLDLCNFKLCHKLPQKYKFYRLATRDELRDYMYCIGYADGKSLWGLSQLRGNSTLISLKHIKMCVE